MPLRSFLSPEAVASAVKAKNKKQALHEISALAGRIIGRNAHDIFEPLLQRERLGSTGIGDGIAIPHCKLARLDRLFGFLGRLEKPIAFDALDGEPVDILFLLLAPEGAGADHLKALARIARVLREPGLIDRLRTARDADALYAVLIEASTRKAA